MCYCFFGGLKSELKEVDVIDATHNTIFSHYISIHLPIWIGISVITVLLLISHISIEIGWQFFWKCLFFYFLSSAMPINCLDIEIQFNLSTSQRLKKTGKFVYVGIENSSTSNKFELLQNITEYIYFTDSLKVFRHCNNIWYAIILFLLSKITIIHCWLSCVEQHMLLIPIWLL